MRVDTLKFTLIALAALWLFCPIDQAWSQECQELPLDDAIQKSGELTTLLKIANFRADVNYMGEVAGELTQFLDGCGDAADGRLPLVCRYDCHLQLGRYSLFMASDLPFLSSASGISRNDTPLSPQGAQQIATNGLVIVDRGLTLLARQQGGGGGDEASEGATYREFVRQLVLLNGLKIRLFMSTGDTWYQTVSEARVKHLDFLLAEATGSETGAGVESQPNLSKAYTNYETAMWTLIETKMDIPGETTYDDLRADLLVMENDLRERLDSVRSGFLFLNIDPLEFTTINFGELRLRIEATRQELQAIERTVEGIVERWHANRQGEETRQLDEERTVRSQQINLMAHKIGKLEQEAQIFTLDVQQEINNVDAERDTFAFRQQIRRLEVELTTKLAEFENRRAQLNGRRELDLIVLNKEAEIERRGELRWLLSFEMTRMNIDLQLSSLGSQLIEYERQFSRNDNRRRQITLEVGQKQDSIRISENAILQAQNRIASLNQRQTIMYMQRRAVNRHSICRLESELVFAGFTPEAIFAPISGEQTCPVPDVTFTTQDYNLQMCGADGESGLRQTLLEQQIRARAFLMQCIVGDANFSDLEPMVAGSSIIVGGPGDLPDLPDGVTVDCGSFTQSETQFARQIWEKELEFFESQEDDLEVSRQELADQISHLETWVRGFNQTVAGVQGVLTVAESLLAAISTVPKTTVAAAGLASGVYTTIDLRSPAMNIVLAIRNALQTMIKLGQITAESEQRIQTLGRQLTTLRQQTEQLDIRKSLKGLALHRAHFQLAGRAADGRNDIKELILRDTMADVDCQSQIQGLNGRGAVLRAEHARQVAAMDLTANENELLTFDLQAQHLSIERAQREIEIAQADIERLNLMNAQLLDDTTQIEALIAAAQGRVNRIQNVSATVTDLADASLQASNAVAELRERQSQAMLALSEQELGFVEQRITQERSNTEDLIDGLNQAIDLGLKSRELQDSILVFQSEIQADVRAQQEEMTALISQIDDPLTRRNLFIANQETLSDLLKGIPEYVAGKRRLLETANLVLHLMRRRYAIVAGITGSNENWPSTYVRNATQLNAMVTDIADARFFDERQINIDVAQIVVPSVSGLARTLHLNREASFEISPDAANIEGMRRSGYFSIWDEQKFSKNRNMSLIDILIGVQYPCTGEHRNNYVLTHDGSGMVFQQIAEGSSEVGARLVIGPQRSNVRPFYNLADSQDRLTRILDYWEDIFLVRSFPPPNGPPNDTGAVLPFLGVPLIGTYSVKLRPSSCDLDGSVYTIYFIFSSDV